jgi:gas vesicle protein
MFKIFRIACEEKEKFMSREYYDRDEANVSTKLTYLLIGGGIGAVVALLFAPKSGVELRGDIADVTRKGIEKGKETASQLQERAGEYYEVSRERAGEFVHSAQEKAGVLGEKAKAAAARTANPFTAAVEAGKDAYIAEKRKGESKAIAEGRPAYPVKDEEIN